MTRKEITMPQLGESVTEGTINNWLVSEGDYVNEYDPIVEVMSDKVNAEVPSSYSGTITEIVAKEGDTIKVGHLICYIETEDQTAESTSSDTSLEEKKTEETDRRDETAKDDQAMKTRYSPAVLKLAGEHNIDLKSVTGTGLQGRITRKDILAHLESAKTARKTVEDPQERKADTKADTKTEKSPGQVTQFKNDRDIEIPLTGVRKAIAYNMAQSMKEIPHAWMTIEVDVTGLVEYRNKIKDEFYKNEGYSLTYFPFFVNVIAKALREFPILNSTWAEGKVIQRSDINVSIAVAKESELYVPVIRNADEKSIKGLAREVNELATRVRTNQITADMMQDGTFTVNNTGSFGSIQSMGVINHPQAAIVQVESIVKRPVIIDGMFAARDIVNLCLSLDHRILDGLICGQFLARVKELLEDINAETTHVY